MIQKILLFLLSVTSALYAQSVTTSNEYPFFPTNQSVYTNRNYSFNIFDGSLSSYTMRQFNQNFVETNRLVMRRLDEVLSPPSKKTQFSTWIKMCIPFLLTIPLTHEEGHRCSCPTTSPTSRNSSKPKMPRLLATASPSNPLSSFRTSKPGNRYFQNNKAERPALP